MRILIALFLLGLCAQTQAQAPHDPLTNREVDQMRDSAQDPKRRIELLIGFARERVMAIEQLQRSTNAGLEGSNKLEELLGDLAALIDELDDNLEMYDKHGEDLRRPLHHVLEAEAEFQQKLKAIGDNASPRQKQPIAAALADASDSLQSSTESANAILASQIERKGEETYKGRPSRKPSAKEATPEQ